MSCRIADNIGFPEFMAESLKRIESGRDIGSYRMQTYCKVALGQIVLGIDELAIYLFGCFLP